MTLLQTIVDRNCQCLRDKDLFLGIYNKDKIHINTFYKLVANNPEFEFLQEKIGFKFKSKKNLINVFLHKSMINEFNIDYIGSNERLEFLGDSVLGSIVTTSLYSLFSNLNEGELSKLRCTLVDESSWANLARFLNLGKCLFLGKGELLQKGFEKESLLSDCFEALIGAIFIETNYKKVESVFQKIVKRYETEEETIFYDLNKIKAANFKGELQERIYKKHGVLPEYKSVELPNNKFCTELFINNKLIDSFIDVSKKNAEKNLAKRALAKKLF